MLGGNLSLFLSGNDRRDDDWKLEFLPQGQSSPSLGPSSHAALLIASSVVLIFSLLAFTLLFGTLRAIASASMTVALIGDPTRVRQAGQSRQVWLVVQKWIANERT